MTEFNSLVNEERADREVSAMEDVLTRESIRRWVGGFRELFHLHPSLLASSFDLLFFTRLLILPCYK